MKNLKSIIVVNRFKKAFTIVEILIAMLILFMAIAFSSMGIKAFNKYQKQSKKYQLIYVTSLSLKDEMESLKEFKSSQYRGKLNGVKYVIKVKKLLSKQNFIIDKDGIGRNNGDFMVTLYRLKITLNIQETEKSYSFLLTKQKRIK